MIGSDLDFAGLAAKSDRTRRGIKAATCIALHREEIYQRMQREMQGTQELPQAIPDPPPRHDPAIYPAAKSHE